MSKTKFLLVKSVMLVLYFALAFGAAVATSAIGGLTGMVLYVVALLIMVWIMVSLFERVNKRHGRSGR